MTGTVGTQGSMDKHSTREIDSMVELIAVAVLAVILGLQGGVAVKAFAGSFFVSNADGAEREQDEATQVWSLERALDWNPADYRTQYRLGVLLRDSGDTQDAVAAFTKCLRLAPNHIDALLALGELNGELRDGDAAARLIRRAEEIVPGHWRVRMSAGFVAGTQGDHAGALEEFEQALANGGGISPVLASRLAVAYLATADYRPAYTHSKRAIALEPDEPAHEVLCGKALLAIGQPKHAAESFVKAVASFEQPGRAVDEGDLRSLIETHLLLCEARFGMENYAGAAEAFLDGAQLDPFSDIVQGRASEFGDRFRGVEDEAFSSTAEQSLALYHFGLAFRLVGEFGYAESALLDALDGDLPDSLRTACAIALADVYARSKRHADALATLEDVRRNVPATPNLELAYADALVMNRRRAEALLVCLDVRQRYSLDPETRARILIMIDALEQR